jgi:hypothetical protein
VSESDFSAEILKMKNDFSEIVLSPRAAGSASGVAVPSEYSPHPSHTTRQSRGVRRGLAAEGRSGRGGTPKAKHGLLTPTTDGHIRH